MTDAIKQGIQEVIQNSLEANFEIAAEGSLNTERIAQEVVEALSSESLWQLVHVSEVKVEGHEFSDGDVIIKLNNGQKLHESEAQELAMRLSEELTMGRFILQFATYKAMETSSIPERCPHVEPDDMPPGTDPHCYKEAGHEGPHMFGPDEPPPAA